MVRPPRPGSGPELRAAVAAILQQQEALVECLAWRDRDSQDVQEAVVPLPMHDYAAAAKHAPTLDVGIILQHLGRRMHDLQVALEELQLSRPMDAGIQIVLPRRGARLFVPSCIDDAWRRTKVSAISIVESYGSPAQLDALMDHRSRYGVGTESPAVVPDAPAASTAEVAAARKGAPPRAAILLVDDEPDILDSLATYIEKTIPDLTVLTASSGPAALDLLREQPVTLILSDIRMPGMDGPTFLEHAQRIQPGIRRLLITAYPVVSEKAAATAEAVLHKPVSLTELVARIREATGT